MVDTLVLAHEVYELSSQAPILICKPQEITRSIRTAKWGVVAHRHNEPYDNTDNHLRIERGG